MSLSSTCNFIKKCTPSQVSFKDFDPAGREQLFYTTRSTSIATFVNDLKDRKSQHEVFCKKSVLQKAFLKFAVVLYLWAKSFKITIKEVNFSNVAVFNMQKCTPSQVFFKDFDPTGREQLLYTTCSTSMATSGKTYTLLSMWTSTVLAFT